MSPHDIIPSYAVKLGELVNSRVLRIFHAPLGIGSAIFANYLPVVVVGAARCARSPVAPRPLLGRVLLHGAPLSRAQQQR